MPLTTPQQISIGALCALYSSNEIASGRTAGGTIDKRLPQLIYAVNQGLKWLYEYDPTNEDLDTIGNYLISICRHQFRAQATLDLNNGGTVSPITPSTGTTINPLDFIVSATSTIATGESSIYFDGTNGNPDFRGLDVNFARGATVQYTTNPGTGELYYGWNKVTGFFQLLGTSAEAAEGERFRIMPDTASASTSSATAVAPSVTVLPGQWLDAVTLNLQYIVDAGEVALFISGYNSNFLIAPTDFTYTSTGIIMTDSNFNSANFPFTLIMKIN